MRIAKPLKICGILAFAMGTSLKSSHAETFGLRCGSSAGGWSYFTIDTSAKTIRFGDTGLVIPATITSTSLDFVYENPTLRITYHIDRTTAVLTSRQVGLNTGAVNVPRPQQCEKTQGF
jgi:hypothetical protein